MFDANPFLLCCLYESVLLPHMLSLTLFYPCKRARATPPAPCRNKLLPPPGGRERYLRGNRLRASSGPCRYRRSPRCPAQMRK